MVSVGALVWISCRPLLKMAICTGSGFILSRLDLFGTHAARGAGQVVLNITLPSLMFSKMVLAFNSQNVAALGPLITMGFIYHLIGLLISLVIREIFWVPHRFRSGIIVAGVWSNFGDIPTAVIMSITASAPFQPGDTDLGVAYISAFILVFWITLFASGAHTLIAKDFGGSDQGDEEVRNTLREKHKNLFTRLRRTFATFMLTSKRSRKAKDIEKSATDPQAEEYHTAVYSNATPARVSEDLQHINSMIYERQEANTSAFWSPTSTSGADAPLPTEPIISPTEKDFNKDCLDKLTEEGKLSPDQAEVSSSHLITFTSRILKIMRTFLAPTTISILLAFTISLVRPLKGLFVPLDGSPIPNAPDGYPPLYFIYDTTTFLGGASIPLSLICLGVALSKMKVPKDLMKLPLGAIGALAIGKLFISPVLGVVIVNAFVKVGFIHEEDKLLQFVAIFFSGMPTATTQVLLTQVYSGTGEAEHLSTFLIPQYALLFVSIPALTAYSLHLLFY